MQRKMKKNFSRDKKQQQQKSSKKSVARGETLIRIYIEIPKQPDRQ